MARGELDIVEKVGEDRMCVSVRSGDEWLLICVFLAVGAINQTFVIRMSSTHCDTVCVQVFRETVYSKLKNRASEKTVTMARMSFALVNECMHSDLHN